MGVHKSERLEGIGRETEMTEVRAIYHHEVLPKFTALLGDTQIVYDIGKHPEYDYKKIIPNLITIDRDKQTYPDLIIDIENAIPQNLICDAIICMGVTEECENPFQLLRGINSMLKANGLALFGIALQGNPAYQNDYWRFTINGARKLLAPYFASVYERLVTQQMGKINMPMYLFTIARKK